MRTIQGYMENDTLRQELNQLTQTVFGFSFEDWVSGGYFTGDYIPYSLEENGRILSNVSANIMRFSQNGALRSYIQIGTVMTDPHHRRKGYARRLMEQVIGEYEGSCDGIYLFGDLSALDFYRKLGFQVRNQYRYTLKKDVRIQPAPGEGFVAVTPSDAAARQRYLEYVKHGAPYGAFDQVNKYGLQLFYTADLSNVYYSGALDCFVVLEKEGEFLALKSVICQKPSPLKEILAEIPLDYAGLRLGFTPSPEDMSLFEATPFDGGTDYRLFCRGEALDRIEKDRLFFPAFSHA